MKSTQFSKHLLPSQALWPQPSHSRAHVPGSSRRRPFRPSNSPHWISCIHGSSVKFCNLKSNHVLLKTPSLKMGLQSATSSSSSFPNAYGPVPTRAHPRTPQFHNYRSSPSVRSSTSSSISDPKSLPSTSAATSSFPSSKDRHRP